MGAPGDNVSQMAGEAIFMCTVLFMLIIVGIISCGCWLIDRKPKVN